jgi:DNA-3-methyladenine glycosylase II
MNNPQTTVTCTLALPADYRPEDILKFHRRDREAVAEQVTDSGLRKGLLWHGAPACLTVEFSGQRALGSLALASEPGPDAEAALRKMLTRMLGLDQSVARFEDAYRAHPVLGRLIAARPGLRVPVAASPFEALVWAIIGQQISVHAAISIRRRLILATGLQGPAPLYCHPDADRLATCSEDILRTAGLTATKAASVRAISIAAAEGRLPLEAWTTHFDAEEIANALLAVRGIGPWTLNYLLLRGYGWLDGSLHGDVAVRRSLQRLLGEATPIDATRTAAWLAQFSPWRALVGAHLWAADG